MTLLGLGGLPTLHLIFRAEAHAVGFVLLVINNDVKRFDLIRNILESSWCILVNIVHLQGSQLLRNRRRCDPTAPSF